MKELIRVARQLKARHKKEHRGHPGFSTVFMTDCHKVVNIEQVILSLPKDILVIIRDYQIAERESYCRKLVKLCRHHSIKVLIAGDERLALMLRADGIHLPEYLARKAFLLKKKHPKWLITTTIHDTKISPAIIEGKPSAIFLSPVFKTSTHPGTRPLGLVKFRRITRQSKIAIYALGGVNKQTVRALKASKAAGVAAIEGLVNK